MKEKFVEGIYKTIVEEDVKIFVVFRGSNGTLHPGRKKSLTLL